MKTKNQTIFAVGIFCIVISFIFFVFIYPVVKDRQTEKATNDILISIAEKNGLEDVNVARIGWSDEVELWYRGMTASNLDSMSGEELLAAAEGIKSDISALPANKYEEISFFNPKYKYSEDTLYIYLSTDYSVIYKINVNKKTVYCDNILLYPEEE